MRRNQVCAPHYGSFSDFSDFVNSGAADPVFYSANELDDETLAEFPGCDAPQSSWSDDGDPTDAPAKKQKRDKASSSGLVNLSPYFKALGRYPHLSKSEEADIFKEYVHLKRKIKRYRAREDHSGKVEQFEARLVLIRNKIVTHNLKFVVKLAKSFWRDGNVENFENLVSAGNIGLIRAVDRFDISRGVRFLTYAANWIALEIREEISKDPLIKTPAWYQKVLKKLYTAYNELSKNDSDVPIKVLSKKAQVPLRHIRRLAVGNQHFNRNQFPATRPYVPFMEQDHSDDTPVDAEKTCIHDNAVSCIQNALNRLRPNERLVISSVYGLDGKEPQNLRQVSNVMGNTGERVRQLKEKGIDSLRKKFLSPRELGGLGITRFEEVW